MQRKSNSSVLKYHGLQSQVCYVKLDSRIEKKLPREVAVRILRRGRREWLGIVFQPGHFARLLPFTICWIDDRALGSGHIAFKIVVYLERGGASVIYYYDINFT